MKTRRRGGWGRALYYVAIAVLQGSDHISSVSPRHVLSRWWSQSPRGQARRVPRLEVKLEGLGHMLLPGVQAGQWGGDTHDVPGLPICHHRGLVGHQLHTCLCQEPWEEKTPGWHRHGEGEARGWESLTAVIQVAMLGDSVRCREPSEGTPVQLPSLSQRLQYSLTVRQGRKAQR